MAETPSFTQFVPGFDFLQNLVKNAGAALPSMGQWVAPTLDPAELEKRIEELRTVQFWLEQNARMLGATIQALEVQRMTLSTLKTMNVQMEDLRDSMKIRLPVRNDPNVDDDEPEDHEPDRAAAARPQAPEDRSRRKASGPAPAGVVDPMQWWGALTKQFTELAATAMKEGAAAMPAQGAKAGDAGKATPADAPPSPPAKAARKSGEASARAPAVRKRSSRPT